MLNISENSAGVTDDFSVKFIEPLFFFFIGVNKLLISSSNSLENINKLLLFQIAKY